MMRAGPNAIAIRGIDALIRATCSCGISTCRADTSDEIVHDARDREYTLRGSESRTLSTVGAFRVVSSRDLRDHNDRPADPRSGDLRHLREEGLIRTERLDGHRDVAVVLTKEGRNVLESHRRDHSHDHRHDHRQDRRQAFYADVKEAARGRTRLPRCIARTFARPSASATRGARIDRVVLDYELKRDYQRWLHERDRDRDDADGRPDREPHEIEEWAHDHDLPYFDDQVHFPDLRIEYEEPDGRWDHVDVEVTTVHYRGAHGGRCGAVGLLVLSRGGSGGRGGGGRPSADPAGEAVDESGAQGSLGGAFLDRGGFMTVEDRTSAVAEFGFTQRQARFLALGDAARRRLPPAAVLDVRRHRPRAEDARVFPQARQPAVRVGVRRADTIADGSITSIITGCTEPSTNRTARIVDRSRRPVWRSA